VLGATVAGSLPGSLLAQDRSVASAQNAHAKASTMITLDVDDVSLAAALHTIAQRANLSPAHNDALLPEHTRVTLHLKNVSVADAYAAALQGTGLVAHIYDVGTVIIVRATAPDAVAGGIRGRILDAETHQPLNGVNVSVDDEKRGVTTNAEGIFSLKGIAAGTHHVTARLMGYTKQRVSVTVADDAVATADISLSRSASALEQVVVTGTVIPTELKAVPSAITVITAKQIEERGITRIDQLFRGDVPGVFALNTGSQSRLGEVTMYSRGATSLGYSAGTENYTNPIKTYVDGVEMADPKFLSQIDPKSIERIEILTGPQASTIYGSNALNGVMQIFTKRGSTSKPQLTLSLMSGFLQTNTTRALTVQHDHSAQVSGVEGHISYNVGAGWNYVGPWTPSQEVSRLNAFGGARLITPTPAGAITTDVSIRKTGTQNHSHGSSEPTVTMAEADGYWGVGFKGLTAPQQYTLSAQTIGATFNYAPTSWWSNELVLGQDNSTDEYRQTGIVHMWVADSTLYLTQNNNDKRSIRFATVAKAPLTSLAQATVTFGVDGWQGVETSVRASTPSLTGNLSSVSATRQPLHNTGGFVQGQLGFVDKLFFTYGLRAEWNPAFGDEAMPSYAPRYGVTYTNDVGPVTAKLRASYGRSTRPPGPDQKRSEAAPSFLTDIYGQYNSRLATPALAPEFQQGGEGGLELYFGNRASLVVTRYNQTVDGLITPVEGIDSVRSLQPNPIIVFATCDVIMQIHIPSWCSSYDANGYAYAWMTQNVNAASIRNQGWELQGSFTAGPFTTKGTYSWTKSRTIGVTPSLRSLFAHTGNRQLLPGSTFSFLPEHTWGLGVTYTNAVTTVSVNLTGNAQFRNGDDQMFLDHFNTSVRLQGDRWNYSDAQYISYNSGYMLADLTASRRFSAIAEGVLEMQNVGNYYTQDFSARSATLGRQTRAGLRIRF